MKKPPHKKKLNGFGKPDATGRSTNRLSGRESKLRKAPKGEPWAWLTRELLTSEAWKGLGVNGRRLIDFLLVEHMNHAALANGALCATYDQLAEYGLTRCEILKAIQECEALGLIRVEHGGRWNMTNQPSRFRLTFYADDAGRPATNDWKRTTRETVKQLRQKVAELQRKRKQKRQSRTRTTVPLVPALRIVEGDT